MRRNDELCFIYTYYIALCILNFSFSLLSRWRTQKIDCTVHMYQGVAKIICSVENRKRKLTNFKNPEI